MNEIKLRSIICLLPLVEILVEDGDLRLGRGLLPEDFIRRYLYVCKGRSLTPLIVSLNNVYRCGQTFGATDCFVAKLFGDLEFLGNIWSAISDSRCCVGLRPAFLVLRLDCVEAGEGLDFLLP